MHLFVKIRIEGADAEPQESGPPIPSASTVEDSLLLPPNRDPTPVTSSATPTATLPFLQYRPATLRQASSELGLYVGLRTLCFTLGCTQVTAVMAAFLMQATNVITPCLAFLAGDRVSHLVWVGTAIVTAGTVLIFFDGIGEVDQQGTDANWLKVLGMAAIVAAAFLNSLRTTRVSRLAPGVSQAAESTRTPNEY